MTGIEGLANFRDTGGMPLARGGATRHGVLYRSDALAALTPAGLEALAATPIGVIVDFRTPAEQRLAPDLIPTSRPFLVVGLSILEGSVTGIARDLLTDGAGAAPEVLAQAMAHLPTLGDLYVGMLTHGAPAFAEVARHVAASTDDEPTAVLVHCTAGKDRTGIATALLLDAVGAERSAVVADYTSSQANLAGPWAERMIGMVASMGLPITAEVRELITGTPAPAIEQAFSWLDAEHGGAEAYLRHGGLSDDEFTSLRARLIQ